jgi:putative flippase GtrA
VTKGAEAVRIYRYAAAGIANTGTAYAVFAALLFVGFHFTVATLVGGFAGMVTSYFLNARWVFRYRGRKRFCRFVVLFAAMYVINVAIQIAITTFLGADGYVAGAVGTATTALVGYVGGREWVFVEPPSATKTARSSL